MNIVVTGGAGFIGCNVAARWLSGGHSVTVFDNLSRRGTEWNLEWLRTRYSRGFSFVNGDVRDAASVNGAIRDADVVFHLAAQTAVTTSVKDPVTDFEVNARGTLNVLESARSARKSPILIYASTNKVYGELASVAVEERPTRFDFADGRDGVDETAALSFHSPYGCSKGSADQYMLDYARIYGLRTVVFRQSCIYGPRQLGVEDQGWVAWFLIAAILERPVSIYGNGKQVRDLLHVDDLMNAYGLAIQHIDRVSGMAFNIGGGRPNSVSVWNEFAPLIRDATGRDLAPICADWRPGDQKIFISDNTRAAASLGWAPRISLPDGIGQLVRWIQDNRAFLESCYPK